MKVEHVKINKNVVQFWLRSGEEIVAGPFDTYEDASTYWGHALLSARDIKPIHDNYFRNKDNNVNMSKYVRHVFGFVGLVLR